MLNKARQAIPDTPIIGWSCPARAGHISSSHVGGYLIKPVSLDDLRGAFRTVRKPIRRVLVVDDDADARLLFKSAIRAIDGTIEVALASGGREALETMRLEKLDLILLDIVMPDIDGWQVITAKNADDTTREIPVFLISALDPAQEPIGSSLLVAALGERLRLSQLIRCSHQIPKILLQPD
jgi:CheY-like chemotaxis protein